MTQRNAMYTLEIDADGADAIQFSGDRYGWSDALQRLGYAHEGTHEVPEHEAWEIREAIEADMEGGHNAFPLLASGSALASALTDFYCGIE